uniref:F-box domain-containing protein n=1 Tax=Arundo donax TaxID=35708 RepID=A0A0A9DJ19_ARUDO
MRRSISDLPEDIWFHIHSLMPMRDAARAACLSSAFLRSWGCRSNLTFNNGTIGLNASACGGNFSRKIDRILRNHSGFGVKIFKLEYTGVCGFNASRYLDSWLQIAVKPGIEELTLSLCQTKKVYNFPCSLLSDGIENSIRYLKLRNCALRPTAELGPLRSLVSLHLCFVSITGAELECLLSNSLALEQLDLTHCVEIICLRIPCALQQLSSLSVFECSNLRMLESKAPNLSSFFFRGYRVKLSLVETLQMKKLNMCRTNLVHYARAVLPSTMPNLETLLIDSVREVVNTPMLPTKFLYLKHLSIRLTSGSSFSLSYDYFSLISFLDASPFLETLVLDVTQGRMEEHESIFADASPLRQMPEHHHGCLKSVKIIGFSSAKSLVELTCHILKTAVSLECLTLDTIYGHIRCYLKTYKRCIPIADGVLAEAPRALSAIRTYIEKKVPATVKLTVLEPCSECHLRGRLQISCSKVIAVCLSRYVTGSKLNGAQSAGLPAM